MSAVEKISEAIEHVRQGWIQGAISQIRSDGRFDVCMVGGVVVSNASASDENLIVRALADVISEQFPERLGGMADSLYSGSVVSYFNDHYLTTKGEVLALMDKARVRLMEVLD